MQLFAALAFGVGANRKKDEVAPIAIKGFAAKSLGGGKVMLSWSAPEAQGGKLDFYQVKWADMPIDSYPIDGEYWRKNWKDGKVTVAYWNMAKNVLGEPTPKGSGKKETMTVEVPAGKKIYFAIRSFDDSHNRSDVSNGVGVDVK